MSQQNAALKLFDLLTSRDFDPNMLDVRGKPAADPAEAEMFSFEYRAESGKDYGTIVILLGDDGELTVFCADNVGRTMEGEDKQSWFAFLEQLKDFSIRNHMSFGIKNINRLRYSMQGQAAIKEGLFESWSGNRTTSWLGPATEARLMVKHKRPLGENDARFRYVESLYIETADGERFKLPFTKLSGGRAMLEHVRQGGKPYDPRGQHIVGIVEELNLLRRVRRANPGQIFEGDTGQLVEETTTYYENLQRVIKGLGASNGYTNYFESWQPAEITEQDVVIEGLKNLFVTQSIDSRIEAALPLLARIQQQGQAMKEANIFEAWADRLVEGTWSVPDTPEKQEQLIELMQKELPVGADATNATEELYDLLGDDVLFDQLHNLADRDANADCRELVFLRMQELSDHPDVAEVVNRLDVDADYAMNPPDATNPADVEQGETDQEVDEYKNSAPGEPDQEELRPVEEDILESIRRAAGLKENVTADGHGHTFDHILKTFKRDVKDFEAGAEMSRDLEDALYDYYFDDMPYGIKKARSGDPGEWIAQRFADDLGLNEGELGTAVGAGIGGAVGGIPGAAIGGVAGHYLTNGEETDEGWKGQLAGGTVGAIGGELAGAAGGPIGALAGGALGGTAGQMIGDKLGGANENTMDYAPEITDEEGYGLNPTPAAMEDDSVHSVDGGMSNSLLQDDGTCNMSEAGEMCPVHGIQECWGAPVQSAVPSIVPTLETVEIPDRGLVRMQQLAGFMIK